ncbi:transposase [Streptomyces sp. NPDC058084]|uniref:transposase n=1 Tax=Streptomyces sp. NPDC058084 TaxID=3346333 RepID=UPI0036EF25D6
MCSSTVRSSVFSGRGSMESGAMRPFWGGRMIRPSPPPAVVEASSGIMIVHGWGSVQRLVPDGLWAMVEPVLPPFRSRPQGGGTAPIDQGAVFTAIVYVLTSGCAWRYLPPTLGVSPATAHRRFSVWTASRVWPRFAHASSESPPSAHAAALVGDVPTRFVPTRRTTRPATWRGCANATSLHGSPGRAWSPPNAFVGTAGRSRDRSPGSSDTAS